MYIYIYIPIYVIILIIRIAVTPNRARHRARREGDGRCPEALEEQRGRGLAQRPPEGGRILLETLIELKFVSSSSSSLSSY